MRKQLQAAKNDNVQKDQILRTWGEQRARAAGAEGVHILICKDVGRTWYGRAYGSVVVTVPPEARGQFTDADAKALHDYLRWFTLGQNKARNDAILRAGLARVREDLDYNGRPPFPSMQVSGVLVGVLGLWGVLGLVRQRLHAGLPAAGPSEPGRLALFGGLLGGMFGTAAGHWIYDTLFVVASRSAAVEGPPPTAAKEPPPAMTEGGESDGRGEAVLTKAERLDLAVGALDRVGSSGHDRWSQTPIALSAASWPTSTPCRRRKSFGGSRTASPCWGRGSIITATVCWSPDGTRRN